MITKGIIAINKPKGWTSFDVVNKLKSTFRPMKVGHLGTLDPMATGVLLVTFGKATRLFDIAQQKSKTYIAEFEFGYSTDTLDSTGTLTERASYIPTLYEIEQAYTKLVGDIDQIPPKYSAKSVSGVRAYDLARSGIEFDLKPKKVHIDYIKTISYSNNVLKLEIKCGSGTYIRAIARDLAGLTNSKATMISLIRTEIGGVDLSDCANIGEVTNPNEIDKYVLPLEKVLSLETIKLSDDTIFRLVNGQRVNIQQKDGFYLLKQNDEDIAIIEIQNFIGKMKIFLQ